MHASLFAPWHGRKSMAGGRRGGEGEAEQGAGAGARGQGQGRGRLTCWAEAGNTHPCHRDRDYSRWGLHAAS